MFFGIALAKREYDLNRPIPHLDLRTVVLVVVYCLDDVIYSTIDNATNLFDQNTFDPILAASIGAATLL